MKKNVLFFIVIMSSLSLSLTGLSQIFKSRMIKLENRKEAKKRITITKLDNQNDLTGTWYWQNNNGNNTTELYLTQNGNSIVGKHCSSFLDGSKLDCIQQEDANSISLNETSTNVFEGTLKSAFSDVEIPIKITFNDSNGTIFFQQLSQPVKEYYLPNNVTMTIAQD